MKISIIDFVWGINRRSGERSETKVAEETFVVTSINQELRINVARFIVTKITDSSVTLSIHDKKIAVELKKPTIYRTRSYDAGHYYEIYLSN